MTFRVYSHYSFGLIWLFQEFPLFPNIRGQSSQLPSLLSFFGFDWRKNLRDTLFGLFGVWWRAPNTTSVKKILQSRKPSANVDPAAICLYSSSCHYTGSQQREILKGSVFLPEEMVHHQKPGKELLPGEQFPISEASQSRPHFGSAAQRWMFPSFLPDVGSDAWMVLFICSSLVDSMVNNSYLSCVFLTSSIFTAARIAFHKALSHSGGHGVIYSSKDLFPTPWCTPSPALFFAGESIVNTSAAPSESTTVSPSDLTLSKPEGVSNTVGKASTHQAWDIFANADCQRGNNGYDWRRWQSV